MRHFSHSMIQSILCLALMIPIQGARGFELTWQETTTYDLPAGVRLFHASRTSPNLQAWYLDVDLNQPEITLSAYLSDVDAGKETVPDFCRRIGAIAAVNGGYFGGSSSYSAVVHSGQVLAQNIAAVSRDGQTFPAMRAFFGIDRDNEPAVHWIYHFGGLVEDIVVFSEPLANRPGSPAPFPLRTNGQPYENLFAGIGGGPVLIRSGEVHITHDAEVFFGSGIATDSDNPRTAVGLTAENHAILLVVDGRQSASTGLTLQSLAAVLLELGCTKAMNLDGGGST
ncbi:phosphodiester glycosidase family protein, partial [candidate division KSB1 bacterium]|nr:phosphodiester glycosidase family protein [candidate division KSB1 bacterium]